MKTPESISDVKQTELQEIGYWHSDAEPFYPHPEPGEWDASAKRAVLQFLAMHPIRRRYRGWSSCRLCKQHNGSSDSSDGVFVWPEGLIHYVAAHDVALPSAFVEYVLGGVYTLEALDKLGGFHWTPYSEEEKHQKQQEAQEARERKLFAGLAKGIGDAIDREILAELIAPGEVDG